MRIVARPLMLRLTIRCLVLRVDVGRPTRAILVLSQQQAQHARRVDNKRGYAYEIALCNE